MYIHFLLQLAGYPRVAATVVTAAAYASWHAPAIWGLAVGRPAVRPFPWSPKDVSYVLSTWEFRKSQGVLI